jgi:MOSC domain-containing protein YiiM
MAIVDSNSIGDPAHFCDFAYLQREFVARPRPDYDVGRVHLIIARGEGGLRARLDRAHLTPKSGIPGDRWGMKRHTSQDGQLTVMQRDVAELVANGQPVDLFGDNLIVELDLAATNLPIGTTLKMGTVSLVVTPKPHDGCKKFLARFGKDALRFVALPATRDRNLRGVYMRVTRSGDVAVGDVMRVVQRPIALQP